MYLGFHINIKQHNIDYSLAPNQQIRMFSEGSYNTDDLMMLKIQLFHHRNKVH